MSRRSLLGTIPYAVAIYLVSSCARTGPVEPPSTGSGGSPPVLAAISPSGDEVRVSVGDSIAFEVHGQSADGRPVSVAYLVDGEPAASGERFVFHPAAPGTFVVEAVASSGDRTTGRQWTVTVDPAPDAAPTISLAVEPATGRAPLTVRLRLDGTDADGTVTGYRLVLSGSGGFTLERSTAIDTTLVLGEGTYQVQGTVEDDAGQRTSATAAVQVAPAVVPNQAPVTDLVVRPSEGQAPLDVVVQGGGSDPDGHVVRYALDLDGDGTFEVDARSPLVQSIRYETAGDRWVRLQVTDDDGAVARDSVQVHVTAPDPAPPPDNPPPDNPPPGNVAPTLSLDVSPADGEAPLSVHAAVTGSDADGSVVSAEVDFDGDGAPDATAAGSSLDADFVFDQAGTYVVRARAVDDAGAATEATATVVVHEPPSNVPPTGALGADRTSGDADLAVTLSATGNDPDGSIATWEIDPGTGGGFQPTDGKHRLSVVYPYSDTPYRTRLRLTDDAGAVTILDGPEITVYRPVSRTLSSGAASGNPRFDGSSLEPAVWSDGGDAMRFTITVRDDAGDPLPDVPVRVRSLRPELVAPDGTALGGTVTIALDGTRTDAKGRLTGSFTTRTSTRVEGAPSVGTFVPFGLMVEADAGHGEWRRLPDISGLNAETIVAGNPGVGQFYVKPAGLTCVNQSVEIHVRALRRADAPGAGAPAAGMYTEIRYAVGGALLGVHPKPGYGSWRTDSGGWIVFDYTPTAPDSKTIRAWVDGQPLNITAAIAAVDCP